jgi:hypothetical protein
MATDADKSRAERLREIVRIMDANIEPKRAEVLRSLAELRRLAEAMRAARR